MSVPVTTESNFLDQHAGWRASLELEIKRNGSKSVVSRSRQKGPLTIQSPFYPEGPTCHLYLLHPPAGIVGGDRLHLDLRVAERGSVLVTTPGATKFYQTNGMAGKQSQRFIVGNGTSLEWLPQETIYYPDADACTKTIVHLEPEAAFIGWDIHSFGLPVNRAGFNRGVARIGLSLYRNQKPLLLESLRVSSDKHRFDAAFLRSHQVMGTMVATRAAQLDLELVRSQLQAGERGQWAATLLDEVLVMRYVGASTLEARELFIAAWRLLRPQVLGLEPCLPRIWAT